MSVMNVVAQLYSCSWRIFASLRSRSATRSLPQACTSGCPISGKLLSKNDCRCIPCSFSYSNATGNNRKVWVQESKGERDFRGWRDSRVKVDAPCAAISNRSRSCCYGYRYEVSVVVEKGKVPLTKRASGVCLSSYSYKSKSAERKQKGADHDSIWGGIGEWHKYTYLPERFYPLSGRAVMQHIMYKVVNGVLPAVGS